MSTNIKRETVINATRVVNTIHFELLILTLSTRP